MTDDVKPRDIIKASHINRITPDDGEVIVGGETGPVRRPLSDFDNSAVLAQVDMDLSGKADISTVDTLAAQVTTVNVIASRADTKEFDARAYGLSHTAPDNIDAINAAITDASNAGGGRVAIPTGKTFPLRPSKAGGKWIKLAPNVTLDLGDAILQVASDADPYLALITGATPVTPLSNVRIVGGLIDQNPAGHETAAIDLANHPAVAILSYVANGFVVDGVTFVSGGVNTVAINTQGGTDAAVLDSTFTFVRGAYASDPDYDNSTVYLEVNGMRVHGNRFFSAISNRARGGVEMHGANGAMTGNTSDGYMTLVNIVGFVDEAPFAVPSGTMSITGNTVMRGLVGIQTWPGSGKTLHDIEITGNTLNLAQVDWDTPGAQGISVVRSVGVNGVLDGYDVSHNTIRFQPDMRATAAGGVVLDYAGTFGVNVNEAGNTRNASLTHNKVIDSPGYGIKIGSEMGGTVDGVDVQFNRIVNAGRNPNYLGRAALVVEGVVHDVDMRHNKTRDTGTPSNLGASSVVSVPSSGSTNVVVMQNDHKTISGTPLGSTLNALTETRYTVFTHDFGSIAADSSGIVGVPVLGARSGDIVLYDTIGGSANGLQVEMFINSADTVALRVKNTTAAPIDPGSMTWAIKVLKAGMDY